MDEGSFNFSGNCTEPEVRDCTEPEVRDCTEPEDGSG